MQRRPTQRELLRAIGPLGLTIGAAVEATGFRDIDLVARHVGRRAASRVHTELLTGAWPFRFAVLHATLQAEHVAVADVTRCVKATTEI